MAISATFSADFSDFQAAVQKAEVSLRGFETGAGKVESSLNRMTNSLSGNKLIQDAALAAEAVERIGGVSKLTEAELARLSAQAKEAAEKMAAMGQDVPANIQKIADATKGATEKTQGWTSALSSAAGAFGLAFSAGAVIAFGKSVLDTASQINDLSQKMGVSTDAVQGFKFAAEQSGSTLDAVSVAITKMNDNLAGGEKGTVAALDKAGLSFQTIRSMKPEDAFLAITDAIKKIPDPMDQTQVAIDLLGKSAAELLPAIQGGFRDTAASADKMSADTIKALDEAGDAWGRLSTKATIVSGEIIVAVEKGIGGMVAGVKNLTSSVGSFTIFADNVIKMGVGPALAMSAAWEQAQTAGTKAKDVYLGMPPALKPTAEALAAAAAASKKFSDELAKYSGTAATAQLQELDRVFRNLSSSGKITQEGLRQLSKDTMALVDAGGKLTPELLDMVIKTGDLGPAVSTAAINFGQLGTQVDLVVPKISAFDTAVMDLQAKTTLGFPALSSLGFKVATGFEGATAKAKETNNAIAELSSAFANMAQIAGGSLGEIVRQLGTLIASADTARKSIDLIQAGKKAKDEGSTLAGILEMTSGVMGLVSAAIAAGKAIAGLFNRTKGRDLVVDFADSMGGFDALHEQLNSLGAEGEKLWINLTQGVGRNNPAQAQAAIDAITKALDKQKNSQEASTVTTEAQAQATIETAAAAALALDDVNAKLLTNKDAWGEWSVDVTKFLQDVANAVRKVGIPMPGGLPGGGGSGIAAMGNDSGRTYTPVPSAAGRGSVVSNVYLDGAVVATSVIQQMPTVLRRRGLA